MLALSDHLSGECTLESTHGLAYGGWVGLTFVEASLLSTFHPRLEHALMTIGRVPILHAGRHEHGISQACTVFLTPLISMQDFFRRSASGVRHLPYLPFWVGDDRGVLFSSRGSGWIFFGADRSFLFFFRTRFRFERDPGFGFPLPFSPFQQDWRDLPFLSGFHRGEGAVSSQSSWVPSFVSMGSIGSIPFPSDRSTGLWGGFPLEGSHADPSSSLPPPLPCGSILGWFGYFPFHPVSFLLSRVVTTSSLFSLVDVSVDLLHPAHGHGFQPGEARTRRYRQPGTRRENGDEEGNPPSSWPWSQERRRWTLSNTRTEGKERQRTFGSIGVRPSRSIRPTRTRTRHRMVETRRFLRNKEKWRCGNVRTTRAQQERIETNAILQGGRERETNTRSRTERCRRGWMRVGRDSSCSRWNGTDPGG